MATNGKVWQKMPTFGNQWQLFQLTGAEFVLQTAKNCHILHHTLSDCQRVPLTATNGSFFAVFVSLWQLKQSVALMAVSYTQYPYQGECCRCKG